jgi:4-hydroxy-3-polyprenylbenzoate decarboxylase
MSPTDLRTFLHLIEQAGQLARVTPPVDPRLELATVTDRVCKGEKTPRALLFEQVRGTTMPVAVNLYGDVQRIAWGLGTTDLDMLAERLERDLAVLGAGDAGQALSAICEAPQYQPKMCSQPACRQVDLGTQGLALLPHIQAWPGDGGCYLTLAQVITRGYADGLQNCGMYRTQVIDRQHVTVRCRPGSGMAGHLAEWHTAGRALPVAIVLGGPPCLTWAACAPIPDKVDEAAFCGYLTGQRLEMACCEASGLMVPATAEIIIEGEIPPGAQSIEGPFGNHSGHYDPQGHAPLLTVTRVTTRKEAIFPWTLTGAPPMEDIALAQVSERLFLPMVRMAVPAVRNIYMPPAGIFHRAALLALDPAEKRPLPDLAAALWKTGLLRGARLLVLCADDCDLHDTTGIYWRGLNRVNWERDLYLDAGKLVIDARRLPSERPLGHDPTVLERVLQRWPELGFGKCGD